MAAKRQYIAFVEGLRGRDTTSSECRVCEGGTSFPPSGEIAREGHHFPPDGGIVGEGHHFPRVKGLRERDTISRTEGRDIVPTRNPETTELHRPDL
ncbi:MAG: hypothetical protein R6U78_01390 [Bacteroidales bacterium]